MVTPPDPVPEWTIDKLLVVDPWPEAWRAQGKPIDYLYCYEFDCTPEVLWPYVADTSAFTAMMRMPPITFEEQEDGRRIGKNVAAGVVSEWEEVPWEWEYARSIRYCRIYHRGPVLYNRIHYMLYELPRGRTKVYVHFGVIGRGGTGRVAAWLSGKMISKRHAEAAEQMRELIAKGLPPNHVMPAHVLSSEGRQRLAKARIALDGQKLDRPALMRLFEHIAEARDDDLEKLRILVLAREWGLDPSRLLSVCLAATKAGVLRLSWDVICPHCRGSRAALAHLGDLPERASCEPCGIEFGSTSPESIEVVFTVHEAIRNVEKRMYCSAEPAAKPHIWMQTKVPPGTAARVKPRLSSGLMRMRLKGEMGFSLLEVREREDAVDKLVWATDSPPEKTVIRHEAEIELVNGSAEPQTFVIESHAVDSDALRPVALFCNQNFRELFSEQALATNMQLQIGTQTILFTDIVGSTAFYERAGDADAFAAVRQHFVEIFAIVRRHRGAVVKTIGDAAMAAFGSSQDALECTFELLRTFGPARTDTPIRLRASLHHGPCIAVNLNAGVDYFGRTVNLAAKLQALVGAHQLVWTSQVSDDASVWLASREIEPERMMFEPGWSKGAVPVFRVTVRDAPRDEKLDLPSQLASAGSS